MDRNHWPDSAATSLSRLAAAAIPEYTSIDIPLTPPSNKSDRTRTTKNGCCTEADFHALSGRERETARVVVDYNHKIRLNGRCQRCHHKRAPFQRHSSSLDFPRTRKKPGRPTVPGRRNRRKRVGVVFSEFAYRNRRLKCGLFSDNDMKTHQTIVPQTSPYLLGRQRSHGLAG